MEAHALQRLGISVLQGMEIPVSHGLLKGMFACVCVCVCVCVCMCMCVDLNLLIERYKHLLVGSVLALLSMHVWLI